MIKRLVVLSALLIAILVQTACSGSALPAGQGNANDGWPLALFVLVLLLVLMAWWFFTGPEKEAPSVVAHAAHDGHGHQTEAGCVEFADAEDQSASAGQHAQEHGSGEAASPSHFAPAVDGNVCYPIRGQSLAAPAAAVAASNECEPGTDAVPSVEGAQAKPEEAGGIRPEVPADVEAASAVTGPVVAAGLDDLKIIEGIGPKISSLLNAAGITTFAQLAEADVSRLRRILADANLTRLADPGTWPEQARLAALGDWDAFKALTANLRGGRRA